MTGTRTAPLRLLQTLLACAVLLACGLAASARTANATTWHAYCWGCSFAPGYAHLYYGPLDQQITRTTNYAAGSSSATAGTGIQGQQGAENHATCETSGCTANLGDFSCGSFPFGAQAYAWNHSTWTASFNPAYYTCN